MIFFQNNEFKDIQQKYLNMINDKFYMSYINQEILNHKITKKNILCQAKITDTDQLLLNDIYTNIKNHNIGQIEYKYQDILNLSTKDTWRYYQYFKENANKKLKFYVFYCNYDDLQIFKTRYPSLIDFFNKCEKTCYGVTKPFNSGLCILWLNSQLILKSLKPTKRIQHEMIHVWSGLLNVDELKSFGKHSPQNKIKTLNNNQQKFINLNNKNFTDFQNSCIHEINYITGQNGLEFESQINDICDAFEQLYHILNIQESNKNKWIDEFIDYSMKYILTTSIYNILQHFNLSFDKIFLYDNFTFICIIKYFIILGICENKDKIFYLNECVKTHFYDNFK